MIYGETQADGSLIPSDFQDRIDAILTQLESYVNFTKYQTTIKNQILSVSNGLCLRVV